MCYFIHKHAAQNFAYQQKKWYGRQTQVIKLGKPSKEGAMWAVKVLPIVRFAP